MKLSQEETKTFENYEQDEPNVRVEENRPVRNKSVSDRMRARSRRSLIMAQDDLVATFLRLQK